MPPLSFVEYPLEKGNVHTRTTSTKVRPDRNYAVIMLDGIARVGIVSARIHWARIQSVGWCVLSVYCICKVTRLFHTASRITLWPVVPIGQIQSSVRSHPFLIRWYYRSKQLAELVQQMVVQN